MTKVRAETTDGRRKLSDEHRRKLSEASRRQWAAMTPDERAAATARIGRKPRAGDGGEVSTRAGDRVTPDTRPAPPGERRSPLAMTPLELVRSLRRG